MEMERQTKLKTKTEKKTKKIGLRNLRTKTELLLNCIDSL